MLSLGGRVLIIFHEDFQAISKAGTVDCTQLRSRNSSNSTFKNETFKNDTYKNETFKNETFENETFNIEHKNETFECWSDESYMRFRQDLEIFISLSAFVYFLYVLAHHNAFPNV